MTVVEIVLVSLDSVNICIVTIFLPVHVSNGIIVYSFTFEWFLLTMTHFCCKYM